MPEENESEKTEYAPHWNDDEQKLIAEIGDVATKQFKHSLDEGFQPRDTAEHSISVMVPMMEKLPGNLLARWLAVTIAKHMVDATMQMMIGERLRKALGGVLGGDTECNCEDCQREREEKKKREEEGGE